MCEEMSLNSNEDYLRMKWSESDMRVIELEKSLSFIISEARRLTPTGKGANCAELADFVRGLALLKVEEINGS